MTEKDYILTIVDYLKRQNRKKVYLVDFFEEDRHRWSKMKQVNMLRALKRSTAILIDYERIGSQLRTVVQLS